MGLEELWELEKPSCYMHQIPNSFCPMRETLVPLLNFIHIQVVFFQVCAVRIRATSKSLPVSFDSIY